jgi:dTDP-4-dehydrorhamnose reductase
MIYTSTDLVYDEGDELTEENSILNPLTLYAKTKLMGEESVKKNAAEYIILRTALVYGFTLSSYTSFFDLAYSMLNKGESVNAFTDQFRNPLYTEDAAIILSELPSKYYANDTINFCGNEFLSRYEMCLLMAKEFGFDGSLIRKSSTNEFKQFTMVKRIGLNGDKLKKYSLSTDSYVQNLRKSLKYKP